MQHYYVVLSLERRLFIIWMNNLTEIEKDSESCPFFIGNIVSPRSKIKFERTKGTVERK